LSPLGMSDHCVLKFDCHLQIDKVNLSGKFKYNKGDYECLHNFMNIDCQLFGHAKWHSR